MLNVNQAELVFLTEPHQVDMLGEVSLVHDGFSRHLQTRCQPLRTTFQGPDYVLPRRKGASLGPATLLRSNTPVRPDSSHRGQARLKVSRLDPSNALRVWTPFEADTA
jgi:hypothetical protein